MSDDQSSLVRRAAELRRAFDLSFAAPPTVELDALQSFLAVTIGGDPHAIRLSHVAAIHADRKTTRVPTDFPELIGIMAARTTLVPVYDLGALLGYPPIEETRWVVTVAGADPVAFAIEQFDGHVRVANHSVTQKLAQTDHGARSIVDVPTIVMGIEKRARLASEQKER